MLSNSEKHAAKKLLNTTKQSSHVNIVFVIITLTIGYLFYEIDRIGTEQERRTPLVYSTTSTNT